MARYARPVDMYPRGPAPVTTYRPGDALVDATNAALAAAREVLPPAPEFPEPKESTEGQDEYIDPPVDTPVMYYVVHKDLAAKMEGSKTPRLRRLKRGSCWAVFDSFDKADAYIVERKLKLVAAIIAQ